MMKRIILIALFCIPVLSMGQSIKGTWKSGGEEIPQTFTFSPDKSGEYVRGNNTFAILEYTIDSEDGKYKSIDITLGNQSDKTLFYGILKQLSSKSFELSLYSSKAERDSDFKASTPSSPTTFTKL